LHGQKRTFWQKPRLSLKTTNMISVLPILCVVHNGLAGIAKYVWADEFGVII